MFAGLSDQTTAPFGTTANESLDVGGYLAKDVFILRTPATREQRVDILKQRGADAVRSCFKRFRNPRRHAVFKAWQERLANPVVFRVSGSKISEVGLFIRGIQPLILVEPAFECRKVLSP